MYFEKVVDYLAQNVDCAQLPCLSGDEVFFELELCAQIQDYESNGFITNMINSTYAPRKMKPKRARKSAPYQKVCQISAERVEAFRMELKAHRIRLGLTQSEAAKSIAKITNRKTSQTSLCRFENGQLHMNNMINLFPFFYDWVQQTLVKFL